MREFNTGATRDTDNGKIDYDGFLSPLVIKRYGEYMNKNRVQADGKIRDSDNWQKGIPLCAYIKSLWRHFVDVWTLHRNEYNGDANLTYASVDELEEALCAVIFNASGYLHELLKHPLYLQPAQAACDDGEPSGLEYPGGKPIPTAETYYT
ncbi:MAG: hypothetical protein WC455_24040 [Dehalococcoidia bacterium]|jgi:hypothetical protein